MMRLMDQHITEDPTAGVLTLQAKLEETDTKQDMRECGG
jgi:hypothetical protein